MENITNPYRFDREDIPRVVTRSALGLGKVGCCVCAACLQRASSMLAEYVPAAVQRAFVQSVRLQRACVQSVC